MSDGVLPIPYRWLDSRHSPVGATSDSSRTRWAAHFDAYVVPDDDKSQAFDVPSHGASGILPLMPGPQGGTREELDWITASSMAEGSPFTIVDVVNIYSSPINAAFVYCDEVR